jgi:hypothetical protein
MPRLQWLKKNSTSNITFDTGSALAASDCALIINGGAGQYSIHLDVARCSSIFFFDMVAKTGQEKIKPKQAFRTQPPSDGDVQIRMQDGAVASIGSITGTLADLKEQINKTLGISEQRQRLLIRNAQGRDVELDEGWRSLGGYGIQRGDAVTLIVREPWQRTEAADVGHGQKTTVRLRLPEACVGVLESVLDYMYRFHRDPQAELALPDLSPDSVLGVLWLAGRLGMASLQQQVVEHLQAAVTEQSAPAYLSVGADHRRGQHVTTASTRPPQARDHRQHVTTASTRHRKHVTTAST